MNPALIAVFLVAAQASSGHYALAALRPSESSESLATYRAAAPASAVAIPIPQLPQKIGTAIGAVEELGPVITAESAVVIDGASGAVLFGKRPYTVRPLASITKLIGALTVVRDEPDFTALIEVIPNDIPEEGHTILRPGDTVTSADLLTAMLVRSDNGAARALVRGHEALEGVFPEIAERVARSVGAPTVRFKDPAGLSPENVGTAIDAARVLRAALEDQAIATRLRMDRATIDAHQPQRRALSVVTTNRLLRDGVAHAFRITGGKTGYLDESGYNLALAVERGGHEVIVVILGSTSDDDRFRDARVLADWTFKNYEW